MAMARPAIGAKYVMWSIRRPARFGSLSGVIVNTQSFRDAHEETLDSFRWDMELGEMGYKMVKH